jgi:hypothetical protein
VAVATTGGAQAASFEFRPGGAQIDGEVLNDFAVGSNQPLDFEVYVDYNDLIGEIFEPLSTPANGTSFGTLQFVGFGNSLPGLQWDPVEWTPVSVDIASVSSTGDGPISTSTSGVPASNPGTLRFGMSTPLRFTMANNPVYLGALRGTTKTVEAFPGNGLADLLLSLVQVRVSDITYNNGGRGLNGGRIDFGATQSLELQQAEVPGPLPLAGAGMAFGFSRQLRHRIKSRQQQTA